MKQEKRWVRPVFYALLAFLVIIGLFYTFRPMDLMNTPPETVGKIVLTDCATASAAEITDPERIEGLMAVLNAAGITRSGNAEQDPPEHGVLVAVYTTDGNLADSWNNFYVIDPTTIQRSGYVFTVRNASFNLDALIAAANGE